MRLPEPPAPAMIFAGPYDAETRCHNETQLIEYGIKCAEAMREACAAEFVDGSVAKEVIRALEIET